jgi:hypothetical protein
MLTLPIDCPLCFSPCSSASNLGVGYAPLGNNWGVFIRQEKAILTLFALKNMSGVGRV